MCENSDWRPRVECKVRNVEGFVEVYYTLTYGSQDE